VDNLGQDFVSELVGTALLVLLGCGVVANVALTKSKGFNGGTLMVNIGWGIAVFSGVVVAYNSGAHLNPAVTIALALRRGFPWARVPGYIGGQVVGAFLAAAGVSFVWNGLIYNYEHTAKPVIERGGANGIESGLIFSANWPHPLLIGHNAAALQQDPWWVGAGTEIIITAILVITVLGIIEDRIPSAANVAPLAIGIVVAALVGLFAPIEMASLNPARDFGPRLWMLVIGYGSNAIPGPNFNIWVTTLMPLVGGPLGAYIYDMIVHQHLPVPVGPDVPEPAPERVRARST